MKNSSRNKILGAGVILGLAAILIILNPFNFSALPFHWNYFSKNQPSPQKVQQQSEEPKTPPAVTSEQMSKEHLPAPMTVPGSNVTAKTADTTAPTSASPAPTAPTSTLPSTSPAPAAPTAPTAPTGGAAPSLPLPSLAVPGAVPGAPAAVPGLPAGDSNLPKTEKLPPAAVAITEGCFNLTFSHKKLAAHEDGEACLLHKNLIVLKHPDQAKKSKINPATICMRINGKAVKYSLAPGKPGEIILGPEAGPNAKITASYCVGKAKCSQSCVVEKDQFLSAIGADEDTDHAQAVGWDGKKGKSQEDMEVDNQMAALNQDLSSEGGDNSQLFAGWILEAQTAKCEQAPGSAKKMAQAKFE